MKRIALIAALLLAGCATQKNEQLAQLEAYSAANKPLAVSGSMKWSAYYGGLYDRYVAAKAPGEVLAMANDIWRDAHQYEAGVISKEEFEYRQRAARAKQESMMAAARQVQQAQQAAAFRAAAASFNAQPAYQVQQPAALQVQPIQVAQRGVSAYFTGKQKQVQTVTYQYGWSCEYSYAGQTFWRTFTGSCPASVQVQ